MAITKEKVAETVFGDLYIKIYDITLDNSYPTNGYTAALGFSPRAFGLKSFIGLLQIGVNAAASIVANVALDFTNTKLLAVRSNVAAHSHDLLIKGGQAAAGTDTLTVKTPAAAVVLGKEEATDKTVVGGSAANGGVQTTAAAQAALVEVSNTTNLSAVTVRVMIIGR